MAAGSALTGSFLAMNAAATLIAGLGLLQNSETVIIGAMLIALLLGPIMGVALGLAEGNIHLLGRSLLSEVTGAAWVLAIGFAIGVVSRALPIGSEILSRTSPNILDLLIGLVGGCAGAFTYVSAGLSEVVVGVAIAISLVPPLTSCGILLAHHLPGLAAGAFLLFLANLSAIAIGAMLVFWLAGYRARAVDQAHRVLVPRLISFALLAVLGVYFASTLQRSITQSLLENRIRKTVTTGMVAMPGARIVNVTFAPGRGENVAWVVVRTPQPFSPAQVARLNDLVDRATGSTVDLRVRSVITAETTRNGYLYKLASLPSADPNEP